MKVSTWAEVIGIVALIVSLVFVGIEIRHNTSASEAQALLDLNAASNEVMLTQVNEADFAEIMVKRNGGLDALSEIEQRRLRTYAYSMLNVHENAFMFWEKGILDDESYQVWSDATCIFLAEPGIEEIWRKKEIVFQARFDRLITERCTLDL